MSPFQEYAARAMQALLTANPFQDRGDLVREAFYIAERMEAHHQGALSRSLADQGESAIGRLAALEAELESMRMYRREQMERE